MASGCVVSGCGKAVFRTVRTADKVEGGYEEKVFGPYCREHYILRTNEASSGANYPPDAELDRIITPGGEA